MIRALMHHTTPHQARRRSFPAGTYPRQPVFGIVLVEQGRSLKWLARETRFSHQHVKNVAAGVFPATEVFRTRCVEVLGRPESELFIPLSPVATAAEAIA